MYLRLILWALPIGLVTFIASCVASLRRNVKAAKESGLPYVVLPVHLNSPAWILSQSQVLPLLKKLPDSWTVRWLPLVLRQNVWQHSHDPFARIGHDTFLAVSAGGIILWTCEPEAIATIFQRRHDFPKPGRMLAILTVFGPNLTASNGEQARTYRKMASAAFNEATMRSVWTLMIDEATTLMTKWIPDGSVSKVVQSINTHTARLALHILSAGLYGKRLDWEDVDGHVGRVSSGHQLSFEEAIAQCMKNMATIFLNPRVVLKYSWKEVHKRAYQSYREWLAYMEEVRDEKQQEILTNGRSSNPNLLDAIVSAGMNSNDHQSEKDEKVVQISAEAVLGNLFIFFLAGHETVANTLSFAMVILACLPEIQKKLQASLDAVLGSRPPDQWTYEKDLGTLLNGYLGAFISEVLRHYTVLPYIPKATNDEAKELSLGGKSYMVPPHTTILINTSACHRNPAYWPAKPTQPHSAGETMPYPLSDFNPEMWMDKSFSPTPGSYIPFSEGFRSCIGQRFAEIELVAALATIFKDYSVELYVSGNDGKMDKNARSAAWHRARESAENAISDKVEMQLALKMVKEVGLRFSKRGHEEF